ncbi:carboxyl-terminal processing protease [Mesobacillus persicus]|uniref:C-terminal processing peptidase n=1 Tax=Mesobacillus persicus TaxID=930146 RepID=A0A1H8A2H1_9BACI|nr:S41 family peptidase [Mesobacillus persicus]SEM64781.1 carboxyl-terminal processing protease [Mesobacillus persicus]
MKRNWIAIMMTGSLLIGAGGTYAGMQWADSNKNNSGVGINQSEPQVISTEGLEKVEQAYSLILSNYVEEVEQEKLIEGAIQGMLTTLEDPYSVYMDAETAKQFNETLESSFEGIGAEVSMVDNKIVIVSPFKDSPAEKAGLKPNDQILKVDGESVEGLDLYEATMKIRGEKGTAVELEIQRQGLQEPLKVKVKRDEIPQITVYADMKQQTGENIGYLEITSFSEDTAKEFKSELSKLEDQGLDGLIIDVRGNPGGFLSSVQEILKELVTGEKPIYQIQERNGEKTRYFSSLKKAKEYPITVLTDKGSASASEILAGALKEAGGYPVIGEKTFGKGTVQQAVPMGDGSNIKLTLFKWLTPEGNWIHQNGIEPSVPVEQPSIYHTHPIQAEQPLKKDMNNEQVKNAQEILSGIGYAPGRTDGYFSDQTEMAVKAFQRKRKMDVTGIIDPKTATALEEAAREEMKKEENDAQLQTAVKLLVR